MYTEKTAAARAETQPACGEGSGQLPACGALAFPYVAMQGTDPVRYDDQEALRQGTLFPGLDLPFHKELRSRFPQVDGPLLELMALDFATPDGNLSLIDDIEGEAAEDKQFIIVQSKNGNYFYIIVDRAAEGENTVHFLNQVDEADLMALMEGGSGKAQAPAVCTCKDKCKAGAVNTACPVCSVNMTECAGKEAVPEPDDAPPEKEKSNAGGLVIFLAVTLLGGGGAFYYFKIMKPKQGIKGDTDLDDFDFEDYDGDEPEAGSEEQEDEE